ncbi:hypothetical protein [Methylobacterium longum]|uniref:Uncharacterized protein n=1 Tax=Methylobacterium longum TaxID=767694 RepID=A0ABT8AQG7_9HYPH|nr:hypothetical protein [Methylobacterium longum]MDN3572088.1 hypothetical protein [Methylobacterium longum]
MLIMAFSFPVQCGEIIEAALCASSLHLLTIFVVVAVLLIHRTSPLPRIATSAPAPDC